MATLDRKRENWLSDAVEVFRPKFAEIGFPLPDLRVSVGYGPMGAKFENAEILGVTLNSEYVKDGAFEIWISPEIQTQPRALDVLIHELIHAAVGFAAGHRGEFAEAATRLGLTGSMTSTVASPALRDELEILTVELGTYPGSYVDLSAITAKTPIPAGPTGSTLPPVSVGRRPRISTGPRQQTGRMMKATCSNPECICGGYDYIIRVSAKVVRIGLPSCPAGVQMMINEK